MERTNIKTIDISPEIIICFPSKLSEKRFIAFCNHVREQAKKMDIETLFLVPDRCGNDIPDAPFDGFPLLDTRNIAYTVTKSKEFDLQKLSEDDFWRVYHSRKSFAKTGKRQAHSPVFFRQKRPFGKKHDSR